MTVVYINAVQYQTCPNHESDNHFFAKIPGGVRTPRSPPLDPPLDNSGSSGPIRSIIELKSYGHIHFARFGTDWSIQSNSAIFLNSRANNSGCSGLIITIIEIVRHLMVIYNVTKFGAD